MEIWIYLNLNISLQNNIVNKLTQINKMSNDLHKTDKKHPHNRYLFPSTDNIFEKPTSSCKSSHGRAREFNI